MEYLLAFQDYVQSGNTSRNVPFSPQLVESLRKMHQETAGQGWPVLFQIIPPTKEAKIHKNNRTINGISEIQYTGKFVFDFFKNGLFYEHPAENAPTHNEKRPQEGKIHFRFSSDRQTIETIYETFTGNAYGKQHLGVRRNNLKRLYFFLGLGLVLMLLIRLL